MTRPSIIEALINIIVSVALVNSLGMIGVAIGTLIAMSYRTIYQIYFLKKNIIFRDVKKFIYKVLLFTVGFILSLLICNFVMPINEFISIGSWIIHGIVYAVIVGMIYLGISYLFYKEDLFFIIGKIKRR